MKTIILPFAIATLLVGCATEHYDKTETAVLDKHHEAQRVTEEKKIVARKAITFIDASYIPMKKMERAEFTPAQQRLLDLEVESNRDFASLNEVATWLAGVANTPVVLSPELSVPQVGATGVPMASPVPMPTPGVGGVVNQAMPLTIAGRRFQSSYSGTLSGFLDMVAASYGMYWKLEARTVRFLLTDSRTFRIKALPGDTQLSSLVGSQSGSGAAGGAQAATQSSNSTNTTGVTYTGLSVWSGIETSVKQLLTPVTGRVSVSPSTGTISVTDTPRVLEKVAEFVREQNASLGRQVAVNVRVLSVEVSEEENYGINWNAVYNNLADNVQFKVNTGFQPMTGAASFVLQTSNPSGNSWSASSGAIINALSTQGRVSEMTSATVVTLNNQAAPVNVGRQVSYLQSSATTQTANVGSTTTLTPGIVQTGFSMVLVPHIIDGKELLLQSSINMSSLLQLATIQSGGASIQSPDLASSNFIQRARINSGDTLVIAGFDQDRLSAVAQGVGDAKNAAAGNRDSSAKRTLLVILIQPTIAL